MLIDSHCHLISNRYEKTVQEILNEAKSEGVEKVITIGTNLEDSIKYAQLVLTLENVFFTAGIYPDENKFKKIEDLKNSLQEIVDASNKLVGIGECGIDKSEHITRNLKQQQLLFRMQIELSLQNDLPLVIHNRESDKEILNILSDYKNSGHNKLRGINHCFVSNWNTAKKFLDLGFYISFSGIITFPSGKSVHETVKNIPSDRYLVETDSPYLAPQKYRGQINYPKYVKMVAEKVAQVRDESAEKVFKQSHENTCAIFGL